MKAVKLRDGIYWVGAIDWNIRNFHGYLTEKGTTYGAYLILDEKIALIDTVKAPFAEELLERVTDIVDPARIDVIVANHVEMDHSGALPAVRKACPKAAVYTSNPAGVKGLTAHYGDGGYVPVKGGDTISLGKRTLTFVSTPMLHWPDNMVTYCPEEKILFSNDAFGQHLAGTPRFDEDEDLNRVMEQARSYYANILMCYGKQAGAALRVVKGLELDMIAPSHGVIWKSHVQDILDAYEKWSADETEEKAVVVYDSMWHSTEKMASVIAEAFASGGIPARLFDLKETHYSLLMPEVLTSRYLAVGSPTLNNQILPNVAGFLCYLKGLSPGNREAFAFGSYGWSGQSVGLIEKELEACGFRLCLEGQKIQYIPSEEQKSVLFERVKALAGQKQEPES